MNERKESIGEFLRLIQLEQSLGTASRQIRLDLPQCAERLGETLLPQRVRGTESICGGIEYHVACLARSPTLPLKELIALPAAIQFVTDRGRLRSVCGIVTEAHAGDHDGGLAVYRLVVRDALAVMEKRINSRIFRHQSALNIACILFDEWRHNDAGLANAFDYELDPLLDTRRFPPREQTMQYNESDAAFVRRLLKRRGISYYFRPGRSRHSATDPAQDRTPAHTLVLFNNPASLPRNAAGTVRYHREDATDQRDTISSWSSERKVQPGRATHHSWDYRNPGGGDFMTTSARADFDQGSRGNQLAASLEDYRIESPHIGDNVEDQLNLSRLRMDTHTYEAQCFHGVGCVRDFCPGEYFTLTGHPEVDTHPAAEQDFVITGIEVTARNNLPKDLTVRGERLFADDRQRDGKPGDALVQVRFTAVLRGVPIVPAYDPCVDLPHPPLQSAIVVGPPGEEVYCDALGRVKIRFPGMRPIDHQHAQGAGASDTPADSAWVRVASNWAGNGPGNQQQCGTLGLPRVGSEVLVAFLGGDPDRPLILSQVFNQRGQPPALGSRGGLPGNRHQAGIKSREIGGHRGNRLRLDDTHGEISAQLASDHGASELNLGWLADTRNNGAGKPRGEGAELRSDHSVAIRGGQGVLVTAEASPGAEGAQLARAGLIGLAELLENVVSTVGKLAEEHAGDEATTRLAELAGKLKQWDSGSNVAKGAGGGAPIIAVSAPGGIAVASPDIVALGSEKKVNIVSGGDAEITAGRSFFVRAARRVRLFAHEMGMKLVARRGPIVIEAQDGGVQIKASGRISIISMEGIDLEAPEVKVIARGAQTAWGNQTITQQCTAQHLIKAASVDIADPGGGNPTTLNFKETTMQTDERMVLRHLQTREPIPNQRYIAHLEDGRTLDGVTDNLGRTMLVVGETLGQVRFELPPDAPSV